MLTSCRGDESNLNECIKYILPEDILFIFSHLFPVNSTKEWTADDEKF